MLGDLDGMFGEAQARRGRWSVIYKVSPLKTFGIMTAYRREWRERGVRRYFVLREDTGRILEVWTLKDWPARWTP